jgi:hypothetical protein
MEINGGCVYGCFSLGGGVEGVEGGGCVLGPTVWLFYFTYIFHFISINLGNEMKNV